MKKYITPLLFGLLFGALISTVARADTPAPAAAAEPQKLFQLTYADAEEAVGNALGQRGVGDKVKATMFNRKSAPLYSSDKPISVEIRSLSSDEKLSRWSANIVFLSGSNVVSAMPIGGRYELLQEVPVLKRALKREEVISESDVELRDLPASSIRSDVISDLSGLIGKSSSGSISPGRPVRVHEIASPAIVKKNNLVQIRYQSANMNITTTGQAVDAGAKGDVISVRNVISRKLVRAVVADNNTVDVLSTNMEVSQNAQR